MYLKYLKNIIVKIIIYLIDSIRPLLGTNDCCIYTITCTQYAKATLKQKPLYISIPLIIIRVLSCNPITAFLRKKVFKNNSY